jgi:hypothetical protein
VTPQVEDIGNIGISAGKGAAGIDRRLAVAPMMDCAD